MRRDPNGGDLTTWPLYTTDDHKYLELAGPGEFTVGTDLKAGYCDFWRNIRVENIQ